MKSGLFTEARIRQTAKSNPRLYQAMDLLYMPLLELQGRLEQELSENPFLELSEPRQREDLQVEEEGQDDADDEVDWEEVMLDDFDAGRAEDAVRTAGIPGTGGGGGPPSA